MANGWGGRRPGAGRKPKNPKPPAAENVSAPEVKAVSGYDDPLEYLMSVVNDATASRTERIRAAMTVAAYRHAKKGDKGIKEQRGEAAQSAASGRFAPAAPPRLHQVK
jgi:phage terminase small subunit